MILRVMNILKWYKSLSTKELMPQVIFKSKCRPKKKEKLDNQSPKIYLKN